MSWGTLYTIWETQPGLSSQLVRSALHYACARPEPLPEEIGHMLYGTTRTPSTIKTMTQAITRLYPGSDIRLATLLVDLYHVNHQPSLGTSMLQALLQTLPEGVCLGYIEKHLGILMLATPSVVTTFLASPYARRLKTKEHCDILISVMETHEALFRDNNFPAFRNLTATLHSLHVETVAQIKALLVIDPDYAMTTLVEMSRENRRAAIQTLLQLMPRVYRYPHVLAAFDASGLDREVMAEFCTDLILTTSPVRSLSSGHVFHTYCLCDDGTVELEGVLHQPWDMHFEFSSSIDMEMKNDIFKLWTTYIIKTGRIPLNVNRLVCYMMNRHVIFSPTWAECRRCLVDLLAAMARIDAISQDVWRHLFVLYEDGFWDIVQCVKRVGLTKDALDVFACMNERNVFDRYGMMHALVKRHNSPSVPMWLLQVCVFSISES